MQALKKHNSPSWFEVDKKGLRELNEKEPKTFIIRELIQNGFDENITTCELNMEWQNGIATIVVEDDCPEGFKDITDAFTLYKHTSKRADVSKRGRYNTGEKNCVSLCEFAMIKTTKGMVTFDDKGRHYTTRVKRTVGSQVTLVVKMKKSEFEECIAYCKSIYVPKNIAFIVDVYGKKEELVYHEPHKKFTATLPTEVTDEEGNFKKTSRKTEVYVHKNDVTEKFIYEMGLPICQIDCDYDIDVQQKVPLSTDRDKVDGKYLRDLYALVLNNTIDEIKEEEISQTWIRTALDSDKVEAETIKDVKVKRFGEKSLIFNPFDDLANDEAISKGYRLIHGSEMSSNEWSKMKTHGGLVSTSSLFGKTGKNCERLEWEKHHYPLVRFVKRVAKEYANYDLGTEFIREKSINAAATFGSDMITFNLAKLGKEWFLPDESRYVKESTLDLLIHELGHRGGNHTEHSYHDYLTSLGAWLTKRALTDKQFFKLK